MSSVSSRLLCVRSERAPESADEPAEAFAALLPPDTVLALEGDLGAGKTTLLRHLLGQAEGRRWAAVVNDMAAINVDVQLVQGAGAASVVELGNGCVCCSVRDELAETIAELCAREKFEHVIVETTGVADPRGVADLFVRKNEFWRSLSDFAELSSLVTVVDARGFLAERERARVGAEGRKAKENEAESVGRKKPVFELMVDQAECADVIVLNKCDLVSEAELARVEGLLRGLNPRAELVRAERGQVASEFLLGRVRFDAAATLGAARWMRVLNDAVARGAGSGAAGVGGGVMKPGAAVRGGAKHEEEFGIGSFVFAARRPLVRERLLAWLETGRPEGLLRAKGFFWFAEQAADIGFLSVAGGLVRHEFVGTWAAALREAGVITEAAVPASARARWEEPHGDRRVELVFIGVGLDEAAMRAGLVACLG
jgi:G3E family GTPase